MSYQDGASGFEKRAKDLVNNLTSKLTRNPKTQWANYVFKKAKKRYRFFNRHVKWVNKWRNYRDEQKYWKLKWKKHSNLPQYTGPIEGLRKPFGSLFDGLNYTWYEIVVAWITALACTAWVANLIYFVTQKSTWLEMIIFTAVTLLVLFGCWGLKLYWRWRPPKAKEQIMTERLNRGRGFY